MDIFEYHKNRRINPDEVFDEASLETDGIWGIFMRLKNVLISELHTSWDIVSLERYLNEKMIPRSFRWHVYPGRGDKELNEWFLYFNAVGLDFLALLVFKKRSKVAKLQQEINEIKEKLVPMNKEGLYQVYTKDLWEIMIEEKE